MNVKRGPDLWQLWRLALREGVRDMAGVARLAAHPMRLRATPPTRLLFAPQDLRTSDPTVAQDIYGGHFMLAGRAVQTGGISPFAVQPPSPAWSEALFGFGWLRHLRAADTPLARENARALLMEAIDARGRSGSQQARVIRVVTRRLISFLCQSPLLLTGADHDFYRRLMRSIGLAVRELEIGLVAAPRPLDRLLAAIGLCYAGLCCGGYEPRLRRAAAALAAELDAQILPDGGHVGRNPGVLVELLLDLLPLRQVFASRGVDPPEALDRAVARMLPMLRLFRHGDGSLALFNGMGRTAADQLATLVSYDAIRGEPAQHASYSGYDRVELGGTVLVADFGAAPAREASSDAHAGCLSFELSDGFDRLVVNCGTPPADGPLRQAARNTAAHSTLIIEGASSASFLGDEAGYKPGRISAWLKRRLGPIMLAGPRKVAAERGAEPDGSVRLLGRHDGYLAAFGYLHERRLHLAADGSRLDGEDSLAIIGSDRPAKAPETVLRFHLHPGVEAEKGEDGSVLIRIARRHEAEPGLWRFSLQTADGGGVGASLMLDDSVFFADADGRRPTRQIVVVPAPAPDAQPVPVAWRFERLVP
jgi:uncharacterized heparinase superfamily protein